MSSGGLIGGVVGAAIGFVVSGGNPMGAVYGWFIGSTAGSILFPEQMQGPRLEDLRAQDSSYGWPIPIVFGVNRQSGNVIWQPPLIEVATEQDAKGGPEVTSFTYFAHAAVLVCVGEIAGIRRIWGNNRLIYDVRSTNGGEIRDPVIGGLRFYNGTETQTPDPLIVAHEGDSPAYRGWAYVVFENLGLSEHFGNRLPNFHFEVVAKGQTATPDPVEIGAQAGGNDIVVDSSSGYIWSVDQVTGAARVKISDPVTLADIATLDVTDFGTFGNPAIAEVPGAMWALSNDELLMFDRATRTYIGSHVFPGGLSHYGDLAFESHTGMVWLLRRNLSSTVQLVQPLTREITTGFTTPVSSLAGVAEIRSVVMARGPRIAVLAANWVFFYPPAVDYGLVGPDVSIELPTPVSTLSYATARFAHDPGRGKLAVFQNAPSNKFAVIDLATEVMTEITLNAFNGSNWLLSRLAFYHAGRDRYVLHGTEDPADLSKRVAIELDPTTFQIVNVVEHNVGFFAETADEWVQPKSGNTYAIYSGHPGGLTRRNYRFPLEAALDPLAESLATIVRRVGTECGMVPVDDLNVDALEAIPVTGYTITRQMSGRAAIEPLQAAYFFDMVESDDKLKAVVRGGAIAGSIPEDDRGAHEPGAEMPAGLEITRLQELESPNHLEVRFIDVARDYDPNTAPAKRLVRSSRHKTTVDLAIVLDTLKASQVAAVTLYLTWQRARYAWKTGRKYARLEPSDVVTLPTTAGAYNVRITGKREHPNGLIEWEGASEDGAIYSQNGVASAVSNYPGQTIVAPGAALMQLMDIPILRDGDNEAGFYAAYATTGTAQGCSLYRSTDGTTYTLLKQMTSESVMGTAISALGASTKGNIFDRSLTVDVVLIEGELVSDTKLNVLNGANMALLGAELIQFLTATLIAPQTYRLSGLLRGRFGTEWAMTTHGAGERFVLVNALTWRRILSDVSLIGLSRFYKAPLFGASLGATDAMSFTNNAVGLEPYAGCQLKGARDGSNNLTGTWKRRTRIGGGWRDLVDVGVGELSEAYEVEIWDAGYTTLKRTIAGLTTPSFSYSAADQTTDFGAPQNPVACRAYQMSSVVGRGYKLEGSI